MILNIEETRPVDKTTYLAVLLMGGHPETEANLEAVADAIAELGIQEPVRLRPFIGPPPPGQLQELGLPLPEHPYPLGATRWEDGEWAIYVDVTLPDDDPTASASFSHTLWHELGHALDLGTRARESGRPIEEVMLDDTDERVAANEAVANSYRDEVGSYQDAHAQYMALDEEKYAEAIAAAHHHKRLSKEGGQGVRVL